MEASDKSVTDVPVRLVIRYSNGIMQSGVARCIAMKGHVLRVLTRDQYETGSKLTAMAAFLPGTTLAIVGRVARGQEAGTWIVDLTLRPTVAPSADLKKPIQEASPEALRGAAAGLAARLDVAGWIPYKTAAFEGVGSAERGLRLAATELAVYALLEEKGYASKNALVNRVRKG